MKINELEDKLNIAITALDDYIKEKELYAMHKGRITNNKVLVSYEDKILAVTQALLPPGSSCSCCGGSGRAGLGHTTSNRTTRYNRNARIANRRTKRRIQK